MEEGRAESRNLVVSDIFFGLAAILLVILALMSASLQSLLESRSPDVQDTRAAAQEYSISGKSVFLAHSQGVTGWGSSEFEISLNNILQSTELVSALHGSDLIIVAPEGIEAGFLLSAKAAKAGIDTIKIVWLDAHCRQFEADSDISLRCLR